MIEDWSLVRSPSRARRRLALGHRQNIREVEECEGRDDPEERCPRDPKDCVCWQVDLEHPMAKYSRRAQSASRKRRSVEERGDAMTTALPLRVTRLLTKAEFHCLDADIPEGTTVYPYQGFTYGCVSHKGRAVTMEPNKEPFFEVPKDAVEALNKMQETMP